MSQPGDGELFMYLTTCVTLLVSKCIAGMVKCSSMPRGDPRSRMSWRLPLLSTKVFELYRSQFKPFALFCPSRPLAVCCTSCVTSPCPLERVRWQSVMATSPFQIIHGTRKTCTASSVSSYPLLHNSGLLFLYLLPLQ